MGRLPAPAVLAFMLILPSIVMVAPTALACDLDCSPDDCIGTVCVTDEKAGDHDTPCEYGTPHDPRYRYINASAQAENYVLVTTFTFACESTYFNGEWFYGNVTLSDGERTDAIRAYYYYGRIYSSFPCGAFVSLQPDPIRGNNLHYTIGNYWTFCPNSRDYPSVVSLLP